MNTGRRPYFRRPAASGAAKGLQDKMAYWKLKDFVTEFNIAVSQALNLAKDDNSEERSKLNLEEKVEFWFNKILGTRLNTKLRSTYEYYHKRLAELGNKSNDLFESKREDHLTEVGSEERLPVINLGETEE